MQSVEYALTHMNEALNDAVRQLTLCRANIDTATLELEKPFSHDLRLRDRLMRQREIDASLQPAAVERTAGVTDREPEEELAA